MKNIVKFIFVLILVISATAQTAVPSLPTTIVPLLYLSNVVEVAVGNHHTCAVLSAGTG
jgi:hypothetical protein